MVESMYFNGALLVGTLVAFVLYIQNFFDPIRTLTYEYGQLQRAMASGSRVFELLDVKPEITDSPRSICVPHIKGEIALRTSLSAMNRQQGILHNVNFHISPGYTAALVGPTGAGKSTIVSLIARFYDVTGGRILIDGHDLRDLEGLCLPESNRAGIAGPLSVFRDHQRQYPVRQPGSH